MIFNFDPSSSLRKKKTTETIIYVVLFCFLSVTSPERARHLILFLFLCLFMLLFYWVFLSLFVLVVLLLSLYCLASFLHYNVVYLSWFCDQSYRACISLGGRIRPGHLVGVLDVNGYKNGLM